jgi:serine protease Do
VIWSADGLIVTSSFNFLRDPLVILVTLADGRQAVARLVARDAVTRLAFLRIDAEMLPTPPLRSRDSLRVGEGVTTLGYGHGTAAPSVARGVVSALRRANGIALQTDAATSPANYGGPLLDSDGRLVAIVVPLAPGRDDEQAGVEFYDSGIGFAVPSDVVASRAALLEQGYHLRRGIIGVSLDPRLPIVGNPEGAYAAPPMGHGVRILSVPPGRAADAGLCPGDVIVAVDGYRVLNHRGLQRALAPRVPGERLVLTIDREGTWHDVVIELSDPDDDNELPAGGLPLAPPPNSRRRHPVAFKPADAWVT